VVCDLLTGLRDRGLHHPPDLIGIDGAWVAAEIGRFPDSACETVLIETPACTATSLIVTLLDRGTARSRRSVGSATFVILSCRLLHP